MSLQVLGNDCLFSSSGCFRWGFCLFICFRKLAILAVEFLNTTLRIHQFLFTRVKRMTCGTNFHVQFFNGHSSRYFASASATDCYFIVFWVYFSFHCAYALLTSSLSRGTRCLFWFLLFLPREGPSYHEFPWVVKLFSTAKPSAGPLVAKAILLFVYRID